MGAPPPDDAQGQVGLTKKYVLTVPTGSGSLRELYARYVEELQQLRARYRAQGLDLEWTGADWTRPEPGGASSPQSP
jgi:hypothetical protein